MEIEKLHKEDFVQGRSAPCVPSIRFTKSGCIVLSKGAVKHLGLYDAKKKEYACIAICCGKQHDNKSEFYITKDTEGWQLRKGHAGSVVFNSKALVLHVIKKTWERKTHLDEDMPCMIGFRIALKPLDDDKNKDVYALLRKKE